MPVAAALAAGILACLGPTRSVSSASIIWNMTTSPVAEANASRPSLIAPATSARATVASTGRSATRGRLLRLTTVTTATFFFTVVPFLLGFLVDARSLPVGRSQAGDHRFTSTKSGTRSDGAIES